MKGMNPGGKITSTRIFVPAMDCPDEEKEIRAALSRVPGVESLSFRLFSRQVEVLHSGEIEEVLSALKTIGMEGHPIDESLRKVSIPEVSRDSLRAFYLSAGLLLAGAVVSLYLPGSLWAKDLFLAAVVVGGLRIAVRGAREIRNRSLGMNALMTVSITGAAVMGDLSEAAGAVALFALANHLEARSLDRARRATADLFASSPETAVIRIGGVEGTEKTVAAEEVRPGDLLIVRPGEKVPVDAVVFRGSSDLNESLLTGESIPVEKSDGDPLYAGTVNGRGLLLATASRPLQESAYAMILRRVEEAQSQKAPIQTFMDRFASFYTPGVLACAVAVAIVPPLLGYGTFLAWTYRALVMLIIACPCAIVLAAPVVTITALTAATRDGILVKGAHHLETLGKVRAIAFDKTGTITRGNLRITGVRASEGILPEEVVRLAGAVEAGSAHPAAEAIRHEARRMGVALPARGTLARTFESKEGRGVSAEVEGRRVFVGNRKYFEEMGAREPSLDALFPQGAGGEGGRLVTFAGTSEELLGGMTMEDEIREEAASAIRSLRVLGIGHVIMLSGDREEVARSAGDRVGIG